MKETKVKSYQFSVVEFIRKIETTKEDTGMIQVGEKDLVFVEFTSEQDREKYFEGLAKKLDPATEGYRVLATEETSFNVIKILDELHYYKARVQHLTEFPVVKK